MLAGWKGTMVPNGCLGDGRGIGVDSGSGWTRGPTPFEILSRLPGMQLARFNYLTTYALGTASIRQQEPLCYGALWTNCYVGILVMLEPADTNEK